MDPQLAPSSLQENAQRVVEQIDGWQKSVATSTAPPPWSLLEQLDQAIHLLEKAAQAGHPAAKNRAEEAKRLLDEAIVLYSLPPAAFDLLCLAREHLKSKKGDAAVKTLRSMMQLVSDPIPNLLKITMAEALFHRANTLLAGIPSLANVAQFDPAQLTHLYSMLSWAVDDLDKAGKSDPRNKEIQNQHSTAKGQLAKIEGEARGRQIRPLPKPDAFSFHPQLPAPPPPMALQQKLGYAAGIAAVVALVGGGGTYLRHQLRETGELLADKAASLQEAGGAIKSGKPHLPIGGKGQGNSLPPTHDGAMDEAIPAPREGISQEEALKKIQAMGVNLPPEAAAAAARGGAGHPGTTDDELIPAPRAGISQEEALKKIQAMGIKGPAAAIGGNIPAPTTPPSSELDDLFPAAPGTPTTQASGTTTVAAHPTAAETVATRPAVTTPAPLQPTARENIPASPPVKPERETVATLKPTPPMGANNQSETTPTARVSAQVGHFVQIELQGGTQLVGYLLRCDDKQCFLAEDESPRSTEPIPLQVAEVQAIRPIERLQALLNRRIQVTLRSHETQVGILKRIDADGVRMEKRVASGKFTFAIKKADILSIELP